MIADAKVTHLSRLNHLFESAHGVFQRGRRVNAVNIKQVDMVKAKPLQTVIHTVLNMQP